MPNYGYYLSRVKGRIVRSLYHASLRALPRVEPSRSFPIEVFSYSGEAALPEQVASIRSFLRHVGRPVMFNVVSDGSYSETSKRLLREIDPCVTLRNAADWVPKDLPEEIYPYLRHHPTGRQIALIMALPVDAPTLYCDSDILFFAGASDLHTQIESRRVPALYLADCRFSGDDRLLQGADEANYPVNTGFLVLFQKLDWSLGVQRFLEMKGAPIFFTNQTMTHLAMHANGAAPLNPRKYVLQLDDQFIYPDCYASPEIAFRHYVNPVRHKFWTSLFV